MKYRALTLLWSLLTVRPQDVQTGNAPPRAAVPRDILCTQSCRYLQANGYLSKFTDLNNLCLSTLLKRCKDGRSLGMQNGAITNSQITASSQFSFENAAFRARLHASGYNSVWASKYNKNDWIQVDLGRPTVVTGVATQGRLGYNQWVTSYSLQFSHNGRVLYDYQGGKVFAGNKDRNTVVKHVLQHPFRARYVRLVPRTFNGWVSMRMEWYGCLR